MEDGLLGLIDRVGRSRLFSHLQARSKLYIAVFFVCFIGGYPAAEVIIEWLLSSDGFVPEGVEVIILQPMEMILLQLRIAGQIAIGVTILMIILDLSWIGKSSLSEAVSNASGGFGKFGAMGSLFSALILGILGLSYAHNILIPFLLEYLANDTSSSGLQSTWQLQSWAGFVTGLYFSSALCFQVPVVAVVMLKAGIIEREMIESNRGGIWFLALLLGALISPPDPISLFLVGGPMLVLLEVALLYDKISRN